MDNSAVESLYQLVQETINGDVVSSSTFTLQQGEEPNPIDEYNKVHKIKFISDGTLIYDSCWIDK